jgi:hypothetical protein
VGSSAAAALLAAEQQALEGLGEIRRAIASEITDAGALTPFERRCRACSEPSCSTPRRALYEGTGRSELVDVGDLMIELLVREKALGYDERLLPVLSRGPLANNQSVGSATR